MLSRLVLAARPALASSRINLVRRMSGHAEHRSALEIAKATRCTLNDLPQPAGSWAELNNKKQSKWNMMLAASAGALLLTIYAMYATGTLYMHGPPNHKQVKVDAYKPLE